MSRTASKPKRLGIRVFIRSTISVSVRVVSVQRLSTAHGIWASGRVRLRGYMAAYGAAGPLTPDLRWMWPSGRSSPRLVGAARCPVRRCHRRVRCCPRFRGRFTRWVLVSWARVTRRVSREGSYGVLLRIRQISEEALDVPQGSLYPALNRLEHQGLIESECGESENRRRAKYYRLTRSGRRRFQEDAAGWERLAAAMQAPSARRRTRCDVFSRLLSLLTAWIRRERFEDGLDDEVRFHLDAHAEDLVRSGVPRLEGIRTARPRAAGSGGAGPAGRVRQPRESAARQSAGARGGNSGCAFPSGPRGPDSCGNSW